MSLDIKLLVHGVHPTGQQMWGVAQNDLHYIEAFYGHLTNVPSLLLVEVRSTGTEDGYCYYTYQHNNILGRDGRTGTAYFALTIRINMYYADVVNMYNILEAAYNKWIIGTVLNPQPDNNECFCISDLNAKDTEFRSLEKELQNYLTQFSANTDIISLPSMGANLTNKQMQYHLLDCTSADVYNAIKSFGKTSISKSYPSIQAISYGKQLEEQIKERERISNEKLQQIQLQAKQQLQDAQKEKEASIQNIKKQYADVDQKIAELKKQLNTEKEKGERKLKQLETELNAKETELNHIGQVIANAQKYKAAPLPTWYTLIKNLHPFTDLLVMVILLTMIAFSLLGGDISHPNSTKSSTDISRQLKEMTNSLSKQIKNVSDNIEKEIWSKTEYIKARWESENPDAEIDISGISKWVSMKKNSQKEHEVTLRDASKDFHGEWRSNDFEILRTTDGKYLLKPTKTGNHTISYHVNGVKVKERTIEVK